MESRRQFQVLDQAKQTSSTNSQKYTSYLSFLTCSCLHFLFIILQNKSIWKVKHDVVFYLIYKTTIFLTYSYFYENRASGQRDSIVTLQQHLSLLLTYIDTIHFHLHVVSQLLSSAILSSSHFLSSVVSLFSDVLAELPTEADLRLP